MPDTTTAPDFSTYSTEELKQFVAQGADPSAQPDTQGAGQPGFSVDEVLKGLRPDEVRRLREDPSFAQQMIDRHANFAARAAAGDDPLDENKSPDFEYRRWSQAMQDKVGFAERVTNLAKGFKDAFVGAAKGAWEMGVETEANLMKAASGDYKGAVQAAADSGAVTLAKALTFYNNTRRTVDSFAHGAYTELRKLTADAQSREMLDELHQRYEYDAARLNRRDDVTAANIHKDLAMAVPALAGIVGTTEVNQEAADFASNIPQMILEGGAGLVASGARGGVRVALASGERAIAVERLAAAREAQAATQTIRDGIAAGAHSPDKSAILARYDKKLAEQTADITAREGALNDIAKEAQAAVDSLTNAAASRLAAGRALGAVGKAGEVVGGLAEKLAALPRGLAERLAPDNEALQNLIVGGIGSGAGALIGGAPGAVVGGALGVGSSVISAATSGLMRAAGRDLRRVGELFAMGESTLPFWRNVMKAEDISGFTKGAAAWMDNAVFAEAAKVVPVVKGAAAGAAVGAGIGAVSNIEDPLMGAAQGAGGGAFFGSSVGALGQWRSYANAGQLMRERAGQTRVYKDLLRARPDELKIFEKLPTAQQDSIANYTAAHPDLKVNYIDDPSRPPGSYDREALPDEVTVNLASSDPLSDIVGHEIAHYTENLELGSAVVKRMLGDPEAGIPGDYTARDAQGNPVKNADGSFAVNQEFQGITQRYLDRLDATGKRRGWSAEKLQAAKDRMSQPDYIAREIWAEQHLQYLRSGEYTRDLKTGVSFDAPSDWVMNSAFLKNALGKLGVVFDRNDNIVRSSILGDFRKSASLDGLMREFYRRRAAARSGDVEFLGKDTHIDENALTKATGYVERYFDATGEIMRDADGKPVYDPEGRAVLRSRAESDRDASAVAQAVMAHLDTEAASGAAPKDPNLVQKRTNADGRTVYAGRYFSDAALDAIEATKRFNPVQMDNLRQLNNELKAGPGREWNTFYQAATKKGSGSAYRSLSGRWRTDLGYGFLVSKKNNILLQSVSMEVLQHNAKAAVMKERATLWNNSIGDLLADVRTYLDNLSAGRPGDTGIGKDKKDFINNLLGLRVKAHGDVNPLFEITNPPKTIITSLRIDRMNRLTPVSERNVPFTSESYTRATKNLRPDVQAVRADGEATVKFMEEGDRGLQFRPDEKFPEPKKTITAYKLFRTLKSQPGELFPLFIDNRNPVPMGKWLVAENVPTKGFSARPGWHAGAIPSAPHLMGKDGKMTEGRVWAEVQMPADKDYTPEAQQNKTKDIKDRVPEGGYYKFSTQKKQGEHGWVIGGALKVTRILSPAEVDAINSRAGVMTSTEYRDVNLRPDTAENFAQLNTDSGSQDAGKPDNSERMTHANLDAGKPEAQGSGDANGRRVVGADSRPADGAEGAPSRAAAVPDAAKVQLGGKRLEHATPDQTLTLVHYSGDPGLTGLDPAKMGKGKATRNDRAGLDASFYFVKGSPLGGDHEHVNGTGKTVYGAKVDGGRIYDGNTDALDYWRNPNRAERDQMLRDAGYAGLRVTTGDGRDVVKLFEPTKVERLDSDPTRTDAAGDSQFRVDVSAAPLRTQSVDTFSKEEFDKAAEPLAKLGVTVTKAAEASGLPVSSVTPQIGGWYDTEKGTVSKETSLKLSVDAEGITPEVRKLAAYVGKHAPEEQNAVLLWNPGQGDWTKHTLTVSDHGAASLLADQLHAVGLGDGFSFDPASNEFSVLTNSPEQNAAVEKLISYGNQHSLLTGTRSEAGNAEFIFSGDYAKHLEAQGGNHALAEGDGGQAGQLRPDAGQVAARGVSSAPLFEGTEAKPDLGEKPLAYEIGRALAARSRQLKRIPYDSRTPEAKNAIATSLADEIAHALTHHDNARGWYEAKVKEAMDAFAELHPEIATDPDRGSLFKALLAITSNGQKVAPNAERAEYLYQQWKDTGRLETKSGWGGARAGQIDGSLETLQHMLDEKGLAATMAFLNTKFTVGELKAAGFPVNGEAVGHVVWGSAIFGPKVGGGFYPNLQGDFSPVTMDLWLMRTWNRINGSYGVSDPVNMGRALADLRKAAEENPTHPLTTEVEKLSDRQLGNWAEKRFSFWQREGFKNGTPFDRPAKRFTEAKQGEWTAPRNTSERAWVRDVFAETDRKLAERGLPAITNADKQALLWYYEKDLYALFGYRDRNAAPQDYGTAARAVVNARKSAAVAR